MLLDRQDTNVAVERGHLEFELIELTGVIAAALPSMDGAGHASRLFECAVRAWRRLQHLSKHVSDDEPSHIKPSARARTHYCALAAYRSH